MSPMPRQKVDRNAMEVVAVKLKYGAVLRVAQEAVASKPKGYATPDTGDEYPHFINADGTPNSLVGAIFVELGVTLPERYNTVGIRKLIRAGVIECTPKTMELLIVLQETQDDGLAWAQSLWFTQAAMADNELPWNQDSEQ